jgi:hypothetical protein
MSEYSSGLHLWMMMSDAETSDSGTVIAGNFHHGVYKGVL